MLKLLVFIVLVATSGCSASQDETFATTERVITTETSEIFSTTAAVVEKAEKLDHEIPATNLPLNKVEELKISDETTTIKIEGCSQSSECKSTEVCLASKCVDPCIGTCGQNAQCEVKDRQPICKCADGYTGDAFIACRKRETEQENPANNPCNPSPCGPNSICKQSNGTVHCSCLSDYGGNPPNCQIEKCSLHSDCPNKRACIQESCKDPCPGPCGPKAICEVFNHHPVCSCGEGFTGDAFVQCNPIESESKPECSSNSECPESRACNELRKCVNPCLKFERINSKCEVKNHEVFLNCLEGFDGNPLIEDCKPIKEKISNTHEVTTEAFKNGPSSSCIYREDCPEKQLCRNDKCVDACSPDICGEKARCSVVNHNPICSCPDGFSGNPFIQCAAVTEQKVEIQSCKSNLECSEKHFCRDEKCQDPCSRNFCGENAICEVEKHEIVCNCMKGFIGYAWEKCYPEDDKKTEKHSHETKTEEKVEVKKDEDKKFAKCEFNFECPDELSCIGFECKDSCPGTCGDNAKCEVKKHIPNCSCPKDFQGDPFVKCHKIALEADRTTPYPA